MLSLAAGILFTGLEIWAIVRIFVIKGVMWGLISLGALLISLIILLLFIATLKGAISSTFSSIRNGKWAEAGIFGLLLFQNRNVLPAVSFFAIVIIAIMVIGLILI